MRRKEREVTDREKLDAILQRADTCHLGLCDGDMPYVVPLNFGYTWEGDDALVIYFHSAKEGYKLDLIARNANACAEFDRTIAIESGATACSHTTIMESVIAFGRIELVEDTEEKVRGLNLLLEHYTGKSENDFSGCLGSTLVYKLVSRKYTGKSNRK